MPAAGSSSRTPLIIAIVVIALGGLAILNSFQERNDPNYQEKMEAEKAREAAKKASEAQKNNPQAPAVPQGPEQELVTFGSEKVLGNPQGKETVTLGWRWTPEVQGDPGKIYNAVTALQQAAGGAKIRVVNLDAEPGTAPEGIAINGKPVMPLTPDGGLPPAPAITQAVASTLSKGAVGGAPTPPGGVSSGAPAPAPSLAPPGPPAKP